MEERESGAEADGTGPEARLEELRRAVRRCDVEAARAVLAASPELAAAPSRSGGSLALEAYEREAPELADLILRARDGGAMVGLDVHEAAAMGRPAALKHALTEDMLGFEEVGPAGFLPLHRAAYQGHADAARLLLEFGADPGQPAENAARPTPLHSAVAGMARALSRSSPGAPPAEGPAASGGAPTPDGRGLAARAAIVEMLVRSGADPDAEMEGGWTPRSAAERDGLGDRLPALFDLRAPGDGRGAAPDAPDVR